MKNGGITPFNEVITSDHRGLSFDVLLTECIRNNFQNLHDPQLRKLNSTCLQSIYSYIAHFEQYIVQHKVFQRIANIKTIIENNCITKDDMYEVNDIDNVMAKGDI